MLLYAAHARLKELNHLVLVVGSFLSSFSPAVKNRALEEDYIPQMFNPSEELQRIGEYPDAHHEEEHQGEEDQGPRPAKPPS